MNNFKSFVSSVEQGRLELHHLDNYYRLLEWSLGDPVNWRRINSLTHAEASFLGWAINTEVDEFLTEAAKGLKNKSGQMFGGPHHVEKKKKFMRPEEMGAATDELMSDYQRFLQPRRHILALAKEKAKETGKSWEEVIGQVNPKDVLARMQQSGQPIEDEKKLLLNIKSAIQNIGKAPAGPGFEGFEKKITAPGYKESWPTTLRKHVKGQEPIIKAVKEMGADADPDAIIDHLKQQGIEIVPQAMQKHLMAELLKDLANKAEKGEALSPAEQDVYKIWKSYAQGGAVRAIDAESVIRRAAKTGAQLFDQGELESLFINKIKQEVDKGIAYEEDPAVDDKSQQKKWQRSIERATQGKANPVENPYIVADYHGTDRARDPAVVAKYFDGNVPNDYFYQQIAKPACIAIHQVLNRSMAIRGIPTMSPLNIDPTNKFTPCGFSNPENEKGVQAREQFLEGDSLEDLFNKLVMILLDSTNLKGWEEMEGVRVRTAQIQALKMVENLMRKKKKRYEMMRDKGAQMGGALQRDIRTASTGGDDVGPMKGQYAPSGPVGEPEPTPDLMGQDVMAQIMQNPEMAISRMQQVIAAEQDPNRKAQMQALLGQIQQKIGQPAIA